MDKSYSKEKLRLLVNIFPLLVSHRTNFGYKSHNYEPCMQAAEEGPYVTKRRGVSVQGPRTTYNEAAATPTGNGFAASKIITTVEI